MDKTVMIIIAVIIVLIIGAGVALQFYKKKNIGKLFEQIYFNTKQAPKSKKNSFILLMFMETMSGGNKKSRASSANKLNNPKYVEIQLLQMSKILKDSSGDHDKKTKQSLRMLRDYIAWEEEKKAPTKKTSSKKNKTVS